MISPSSEQEAHGWIGWFKVNSCRPSVQDRADTIMVQKQNPWRHVSGKKSRPDLLEMVAEMAASAGWSDISAHLSGLVKT